MATYLAAVDSADDADVLASLRAAVPDLLFEVPRRGREAGWVELLGIDPCQCVLKKVHTALSR
jgi:hypothetical protein